MANPDTPGSKAPTELDNAVKVLADELSGFLAETAGPGSSERLRDLLGGLQAAISGVEDHLDAHATYRGWNETP